VISIFLIYGASGRTLTKVEVNDVIEQGSEFVVQIADAKTNVIRSFTVKNEYAEYVRKYKQMRPANVAHDRFFLTYQKGKCTVQPLGKHKFEHAPKTLAKFLKLEDADNYTCSSFRKESIPSKRKIGGSNLEPSTETNTSTNDVTILRDADVIAFDVLPEKSRVQYLRSYERLMAWKTDEKIDKECFSETVMLEYFNYMKSTQKYKPPTLWAEYSKTRTIIQKKHNVDIHYPELMTFLRTCKFGYQPQKLLVFEQDDLQRFLAEADDNEFLAVKVRDSA